MKFRPATFLFVGTALLLTTFASTVQAAGVVDNGAGASQPVGGTPGGLRATNAADGGVVTTDNTNNNGRRILQDSVWYMCNTICTMYHEKIDNCGNNYPVCKDYVKWYKKRRCKGC